MITYKVFKSDYSENILPLVQDLLIMGKECGHIENVNVFTFFYEVTSKEVMHSHFTRLINK